MREFWKAQGLRESLLSEVDRYRQRYPWQGDRLLAKPRYRYYGREIIEQAVTAIIAGENLLLVGPKATGKNVLAENLAAAFGRPDWNISFHINMDSSYLLGTDTFCNGAVEFRPGPVYECAEAGGFGVLDEINMARNEALAVLHSLLDFRRILDVPGYGRLRLHPATRFIATMNYGYAGTRELNEALTSRFVVLQLPAIGAGDLERLIGAEFPRLTIKGRRLFVELFADLQQKCEYGEISSKAVDIRGLLDAIRLMEFGLGVYPALSMGIIHKCFDGSERELVRDIVALRISEKMEPSELFD
jgi:MoxR-like ATPase